MGDRETLGRYIFFPRKYHYICYLKLGVPSANAKKAILKVLHRLNGHKIEDDFLNFIVGPDTEIILEFGVADGISFDYLNAETLDNILKAIDRESFPLLDFLCIVKYYRLKNGKRIALRFDFFLLRFLFGESGGLSVQVFHERGLQRINAEELISFLVKEISLELSAERMLNSNLKEP